MGHSGFLIAIQILLFAVVVSSAYTDITIRKVYDWITIPATVFGATLNYVADGAGGGPLTTIHNGGGLSSSALGWLVGFGIFFVVWLRGGLGFGDVKLMGAIGALKGFPFIIGAMFWSSLVGAIMALGALAWRGRLLEGLAGSGRRFVGLARPQPVATDDAAAAEAVTVPYGFAIAVGTMAYWAMVELGGAV
jgi:prepilin peptidase CpaA